MKELFFCSKWVIPLVKEHVVLCCYYAAVRCSPCWRHTVRRYSTCTRTQHDFLSSPSYMFSSHRVKVPRCSSWSSCRGLAAWRRFYLWWKIFFRWKYIFTWFKSKNTSMDKHIILKNFWAKKNKRKIIKRFGFQRMPCVVLKERGGNNGGIKNRLFIFTLQLNPDHLLKENIPQMICSVILHTEVGLKLSKISVSSEKVFFCHVFAGLHSLWWIFTAKSKLHVMKMFFNQMYLFLVWVCN